WPQGVAQTRNSITSDTCTITSTACPTLPKKSYDLKLSDMRTFRTVSTALQAPGVHAHGTATGKMAGQTTMNPNKSDT
ncbi:MAG: hypothetical protein KGO50_11845, partial [Myxococcales bacterium]|nr:hypothetical protein [Myxococcales bacterium]